jgi:hypothetical protein
MGVLEGYTLLNTKHQSPHCHEVVDYVRYLCRIMGDFRVMYL